MRALEFPHRAATKPFSPRATLNAAKAIAAKPADADAILEQNGMDRPAFEAAMVAIAKDQWKTDLFLTAYQQPAAGG